MLFLAVFCGFLAEYKLEHTIEHQRGKKLIKSLIGDLKTDIASFKFYIYKTNRSMVKFDSLFSFLENYRPGDPATHIYGIMRQGIDWGPLRFSTGTLQQLKNAGGFRLIRKQSVIDSIQLYEKFCNQLIEIDERISRLQMDYRDLLEEIADARFLKYTRLNYELNSIPQKETLLPASKEILNKVLIKIDFIINNEFVSLNSSLPPLRAGAEKLIEFLKKEYHLE